MPPAPAARVAAAAAGDSGEAPPAPPEPEQFLGDPLIFGPPADCTAGEETATLLMLAPGAMTAAADYEKLAAAVQAEISDHVRLTIGVANIDWPKVLKGGPGAYAAVVSRECFSAMVDSVVAAASNHIKVKKTQTGRFEDNVFVGGHSIMGCVAVRYALEQAGGLILLGSAMLPAISGLFPTASSWTRPVLQLSAELDGQQYLSKQALGLVDTVETAAKLGLRHASTFQPNLIVEGMNHAQFASGQERKLFPNAPPLDLEPGISHEEAVQQAGSLIAHFLTAHRGSDEAAQAAGRWLMVWQRISASIVDPFLDALGRGSPLKAVAALEGYADLPKPQALQEAGIIPGAFGGERLRDDEASRKWLAHPGELAVARTFAEEVQRSAVPQDLADRVIVAVTAHTDEATFLFNQPTIDPLPGGKVLVHAHVYLWRHALETQERIQPAVAPEYAMKLRTASAICRALGEDEEAERQTVSHISGRAINESTFEAALKVTRSDALERYVYRGKQFSFADDRQEGPSPKEWVQQQHVSFEDVAERQTKITSPAYNTQKDGEPVPKLPNYSRGLGRFVGNHYIKVVSLARAIEWLMIDTLRPSKLQQPK